MNWFRYNNFTWGNIGLLCLILNCIIIAFFNNSKMQIESVSTEKSSLIKASRQVLFNKELKQNISSLLDQLFNGRNVEQLSYPHTDMAFWVVARNGIIINETGLPPDIGLTKEWQKHFMLGAHIGSKSPRVFETKSLKLLQQPITYKKFIEQQYNLHSLQVGFHNASYCYAAKNRYSILVLFNSKIQERFTPKIEKKSILYVTNESSLQIIISCLLISLLLILLNKTILGFWIKRKFARQYALFYFSLLGLLAAFLIIQIFSIVKVKQFNVNQNLKRQFKQNLSAIENKYPKYRKEVEKRIVTALKNTKENESIKLLKDLDVEICHVSKKELFSREFNDNTELSHLMCKLYGHKVYTQKHKPNELVKRSLGNVNKEILWTNTSESSKEIAIALISTKTIQNNYFDSIKTRLPENWFISKLLQNKKPDEIYLNMRLQSNIFDFDVVYSKSKESAFSDIHKFESTTHIIIIIVFLLAIPSWYFMSLSMTEPIDKIFEGLSNVRHRKWHTIEVTSKNEFGKVMLDFNHMVERLRDKSELSSFVAEQILELLSNEEGELINQVEDNAAVLFSDIRSFTSISESHDPQEVVDMLNKYFGIWESAVQRRGGVIERFIGDAVVVIFFERFSKQYCQDAVQCAMDVMSQMPSFNDQRFQKKQFTVRNGVGISQGKVRFSVIGDTIKKHLFASGQAVINSEKLESLSKNCKKSMIIVDEDVYQSTRYQFDYHRIDNNLFRNNLYELELDKTNS